MLVYEYTFAVCKYSTSTNMKKMTPYPIPMHVCDYNTRNERWANKLDFSINIIIDMHKILSDCKLN